MSTFTPAPQLNPERNGHCHPAAAPAPCRSTPPDRQRAGRWVLFLSALVVVGLGGALAAGTLPRWEQEAKVQSAADEAATAPQRVTVAVARRAAVVTERTLPGSSLPLLETAIYARATGYLKERRVDIGDHVQEGQLLAVISAPDVDDQLAQARANVAQARADLELAKANAALAQTTLDRDLKSGVGTTLQQIDQDRATVATSRAKVDSVQASIQVNEAMVQRFQDLQNFQKITAPFAGKITAKNVDPGDLISADNTSTRELFHLMRTDTLRVMVNVPQVFAADVKVGQTAVVFRREDPATVFAGKVTRTAGALDTATRTLLTEVQVPNPEESLQPGMYLQVKFTFDRARAPVLIPAAALATRTGGPRVAVVDAQHRVHYRTVQLGRDFGAEVEVIAGLAPGETVVLHSGDDLTEGEAVRAALRK